ncbi:MAG: hypothetical protein E7203_02155 [Selenomonas ruminantium]|jgi:hypothetical protein|uniref:Uncharacterized protein n=2 Tax=Selenomonas ruminantium TaxID=971 RepID=A0A927ZU78_SELRU|nr:hypothetical protein [Selenomonas ruminantium]
MVIMMYRSKAAGMAVFIGMIMAGSLVQAAEGTVSTVDSQELFRSRLVTDNKGSNAPQAAKAVDEAVSNLPQLNSRLRWSAVKTPAELEEEKKAAQRQKKAIPIIITAADIDKERKAKKKGEKTDTPALISPRPIQPPQITPVQQPAPKKPAAPSVPADTLELPPIQPVSAVPQQQAKPQVKAQETAELPPITPVGQSAVPVETIMDAIVESTSIELVINDITNNSVELPAIQPVK